MRELGEVVVRTYCYRFPTSFRHPSKDQHTPMSCSHYDGPTLKEMLRGDARWRIVVDII